MQNEIESLFDHPPAQYGAKERALFDEFQEALNRGEIRSAEPDASSPTGWRVNTWVKKGILLGFRIGVIVDMSAGLSFFATKIPTPQKTLGRKAVFASLPGVERPQRLLPRQGRNRCMPPMFINAGRLCGRWDHGADSHRSRG